MAKKVLVLLVVLVGFGIYANAQAPEALCSPGELTFVFTPKTPGGTYGTFHVKNEPLAKGQFLIDNKKNIRITWDSGSDPQQFTYVRKGVYTLPWTNGRGESEYQECRK